MDAQRRSITGHDGYSSYYMEIELSDYMADRLISDFREYRVWSYILGSGLAPVECYDSEETRNYLYGKWNGEGQYRLIRPYIANEYPILSIGVLSEQSTDYCEQFDQQTDTSIHS